MAYVKIHFVKHVQNVLQYIQREMGDHDLVNSFNCSPKTASDKFDNIRTAHKGQGDINGIHVIQSWSPDDSKKFDAKKFESLGKELVDSYFPGHAYVIATHTGTGKTHNHIVICPWHSDTGKKIENKKFHLNELRTRSNEISLREGLSIIRPTTKEKEARLPDKVRRMIRFNGRSYLLDLMQKADFARTYATSFDNYVAILNGLDIQAVVKNKNITYFYPGKKQGKRGNKLGKNYDKAGLAEAFEKNVEKIRANPKLVEHSQRQINAIRRDPTELTRALQNVYAASKQFTKFQGTGAQNQKGPKAPLSHRTGSADVALGASLIPLNEIARAKSKSIIDYAKRNKIGITPCTDGSFTLTDRPYVSIRDNQWTNTKNRTRGSIIEFVALHRRSTYLQAISEINGTSSLLEIERSFGIHKRSFDSFFIPNEKRLSAPNALQAVNNLLGSFSINTSRSRSLLETDQMQVESPGLIRLFSRNDYSSGLEFTMNEDKSWKAKTLGQIKSPFHTTVRGRNKAIVFTDPFTFIHHGGGERVMRNNRDSEILAMFSPNEKVLDNFLSENPKIKEIQFVPPSSRHGKEAHDIFVNNLKPKFSGGKQVQINIFERSVPSRTETINF